MFVRVNTRKAFLAAGTSAVIGFAIFALIHAFVIRAAYPGLTAAMTTLAAFATSFVTYVVCSPRSA
jgi:hypothetical protein